MVAIADELGVGVLRDHSGTDDTWLAVMEAAHAVIGVNEAGSTGTDGAERLCIRCIGVTDSSDDTFGGELRDVLFRLVVLGSKSALHNHVVRALLPALVVSVGRRNEVLRVLGALVLVGEEGALEVDARHACAHEAIVAACAGVADGLALLGDVVHGIREGRRKPGGGAAAGKLERCGVQAFCIAVGRCMAEEAMDMGIDKARETIASPSSTISVSGFSSENLPNLPSLTAVSLSRHLRREDEVLCMQRVCCHGTSLWKRAPQKLHLTSGTGGW